MGLHSGERIANYELIEPLGKGGMASVWRCRRLGSSDFSREVVIKFMDPSIEDDPMFQKMFVTEARLASFIHHPNVINVEELGQHNGAPFMVMEYVAGCTLAQLLEGLQDMGRGLGAPLAVAIASRVAEALQAAHTACDDKGTPLNLVHRDVTPSNILMGYSGFVKLADFGVAKTSMAQDKTKTGMIKGKFQYMSPEQATGQPIDVRTDIFSLGVVLWEMLTSRTLFEVADVSSFFKRLATHEVQPPSQLVDHIPKALDELVLKSLRVEPSARISDAHTFKKALAKALPEALSIDSAQIAGVVRHVMDFTKKHPHQNVASPVPSASVEVAAKLVFLTGPKKGDELPLRVGDQRWVFGRGRQSTVVVSDDELSRQHFEIASRNGRFEVMDLGSKNGTWLNQKKIDKDELKSGDVIRVGLTQIKFLSMEDANQSVNEDVQQDSLVELTRTMHIST